MEAGADEPRRSPDNKCVTNKNYNMKAILIKMNEVMSNLGAAAAAAIRN